MLAKELINIKMYESYSPCRKGQSTTPTGDLLRLGGGVELAALTSLAYTCSDEDGGCD